MIGPPIAWSQKAPRLKTMAKWINENTTLIAVVEKRRYDTDGKVGRIRIPRKGRVGNCILVFRDQTHNLRTGWSDPPLLTHNSAETYRANSEVVSWLKRYLQDNPHVIK